MIGETRNQCLIMVGKPIRKWPLRRLRKWERGKTGSACLMAGISINYVIPYILLLKS
jgi:hypothetical protein